MLEGRTAIVTGASEGVGRGIATCLAAHGANVAVVARTDAKVEAFAQHLCAIHGEGRAVAIAADVSTAEGCQRVVDTASKIWEKVDILVNNAGRPAHRPFLENDDEEWQGDYELKVLAVVRLARLLVPLMRRTGGGRILNILSTGAKSSPAGTSPTAITRAGGLSLTKLLANEFAKDKILVNALLLGRVKSDQWVRAWTANGQPGTLDGYYEELGKKVPLGRFAEPEEVGEFAAFLLSDAASYLTGAGINFDGGMSPVS